MVPIHFPIINTLLILVLSSDNVGHRGGFGSTSANRARDSI